MVKKLALALIIAVLIVQSIGGIGVQADEDTPGGGTTPSSTEANISVKINKYSTNKKIYKDDDFSVVLTITNHSNEDIKDIYVTVDRSSSFYIPSDKDQTYSIVIIEGNGESEETDEIPLRYKGSGNELILNIKYTLDNNTGSTNATLYIDNVVEDRDDDKPREPVDTSKYKPNLVVGTSIMPIYEAGEISGLSFYVENQSQYSAKNIVVSLEPTDDSSAVIFNTTKLIKTIDKIDSNTRQSLFFLIEIDQAAKTGIYSLKVSISYANLYNDTFETSETIRIKVENNNSPPEISLAGIETSPEVIKPGEGAKLKLQFKNTGTLPASDIRVSLTGLRSDGFIVADGVPEKHLKEIAGSGIQTVEFDLICSHKMEDGYRELGIKLEYKNADGETKSYDSQIFLPVAASGDMSKLRNEEEEDDGEETRTVPRLIINEYELSDVAVKAGQKIGVSLSFLNTSKQIPIRNLKATFVSLDGVFTTEGSNSFFVQEVGPGKSFQKDVNVFARPDAEPKIYNLTIKLEYEDDKGNPYTADELISIPVQQDAKLVVGDLNIPPENYAGQPIPIYVEFYNMGKATLYNLMIKVEGDFEEAKPSYFVGNFESGRSDYFDVMLTIYTPGEISGKVVFTFEDSAGNPSEIVKDFVLNVIEMPMPPDMGDGMYPGMEPPVESGNNNLWIWIGSIAGIVIIIIVVIILRRRRNKKEGMIFDEAI